MLRRDGVDLAKPRSGALSVGEPPLYGAEQRGHFCTLLLYWGSLGGADVGESPSMAVDRGRPEPTQGRLPRYSARDGIGILVLLAHLEVELDVAFHVLRRFSTGAGAVQKVWKYRQRFARTTLSAPALELKEKEVPGLVELTEVTAADGFRRRGHDDGSLSELSCGSRQIWVRGVAQATRRCGMAAARAHSQVLALLTRNSDRATRDPLGRASPVAAITFTYETIQEVLDWLADRVLAPVARVVPIHLANRRGKQCRSPPHRARSPRRPHLP
jgi:hypothetical protein